MHRINKAWKPAENLSTQPVKLKKGASMKKKKYLQGITFFVSPEMYGAMKEISDQREISLSELLRELIQKHLESRMPDLPVNLDKGEQ